MRRFYAKCIDKKNYMPDCSCNDSAIESEEVDIELIDPLEFKISDAFDCELKYDKTKLDFMNPYVSGTEAYFGENNEFKIKLVGYISDLRECFNGATSTDRKKSERKLFVDDIKKITSKIEKLVEKSFNIEKCYIGVFEDKNAFCFPLCWDKNLVTIEKEKGKRFKSAKVNNPFKASLEDIMETKSGFKYKDPKGKLYIIGLGLGFFRQDYTDEEISAVLLHELGHAMQQAVCTINENLASAFISNSIQAAYTLLDPFIGVASFGFSWLVGLFEMISVGKLSSMDPEELGDEIIIQGIGSEPNEYDREKLAEEIIGESNKTLKKLPNEKKGNVFLKFIGRFIMGFFVGLFMMTKNILYPFLYIINVPRHILLGSNAKFLKKNKRFEQFADMFAASYGLGPQQASALAKLGEGHKVNLYTLNWINYVPVLNVAIAVGSYMENNIECLLAGYPDMKKRIVGVYKTVKYELDNNKDLTSEQKKELTNQIEALNSVYDDYVFDYGPKGFVYALWHKITLKSLKNESSDIEGNVLEVLKEMDETNKLRMAKEKQSVDKKVVLKKSAIRKGVLAVIKELKDNNILTGLVNKFSNV